MEEQAPAFQFYPGDWLGSASVSVLTLEAEGAYTRLLCYCWRDGDIPADPDTLARLIGKGATSDLVRVLIPLFEIDKRNPERLRHARLDKERRKQKEWRRKSSEGGKKSAAKRWGLKDSADKGGYKGGYGLVTDCLQPNGNSSSSSSSSSSCTENITNNSHQIPTIQQVQFAGEKQGCPKEEAEKFFHHFESMGWIDKNGHPIRKWESKLASWVANWRQERFKAKHVKPNPRNESVSTNIPEQSRLIAAAVAAQRKARVSQ